MRYKYGVLAVILAAVLLCAACRVTTINDSEESIDAEPTESQEPQETERPWETEQPQTTEQPQPTTAAASGYDVGDALPDFSVPTVDGGTFTLSENTGKPVFINLFTTWCGPCADEMPEIDRLYTELGDEVTFIAVDIGEDSATAQSFADSNGYSLPFAYSEDGAPFADYTVEYIPQTFILDADGTIVEFFDGSSDYDSFLSAIQEALQQ